MTFNEANTVEAIIRDRLTGTTIPANVTPADLPRHPQEMPVERSSNWTDHFRGSL